jgi:thiol-disulfide isomerase/thioredoxin
VVALPLGAVVLVVVGSRLVSVPTSSLDGQPAPAFELPVLAGPGAVERDRIALGDLRGRVVLLDFWATWCPPCRESIPILSRIHDSYDPRGVSVIGINLEDLEQPALASAHRAFGGTFPTVQDAEQVLKQAYGVIELPTLVVIDREGRVHHMEVGVPDEGALTAQIEDLLE